MGAFDISSMLKTTLEAMGAGEWGTLSKRPLFYHFLVPSLPVPALLDSCLSKLCLCFNGTVSPIKTSFKISIYHIVSLTTC